jgi:hypothetical protein
MLDFTILYDEPQEADWFRGLHPALKTAKEEAITVAQKWPSVKNVLAYDRPDIILLDGDTPVLVVEETVEVPSGHNVGQRFARIAAAAEAGVPCLYFGPYVAKKHGGATAGPRYMNVRLFHALDAMERTTRAAITTINWPVDAQFEVRRDRAKDADVREYVATFMDLYAAARDLKQVNAALLKSNIHSRMIVERNTFVKTSIRNPEQYDGPPDSVEFLKLSDFRKRRPDVDGVLTGKAEVVLYNVGMNNIRSDPYTGMAMLYRYLYIAEHPSRALTLWFPNITEAMWREAAARNNRKDIRLFRIAADAVLFADQFLPRARL